MNLNTDRLSLQLQSPADVLKWVETLGPDVRAEISPLWLQRLQEADEPDPWSCMFSIINKTSNSVVGSCGFKAPPDEYGTVEIAYGIDESSRGFGYAAESAGALVDFAWKNNDVKTVRAHTKSENAASERVLQELGFAFVGVFEDPEDGTVNRWEINPNSETHSS